MIRLGFPMSVKFPPLTSFLDGKQPSANSDHHDDRHRVGELERRVRRLPGDSRGVLASAGNDVGHTKSDECSGLHGSLGPCRNALVRIWPTRYSASWGAKPA